MKFAQIAGSLLLILIVSCSDLVETRLKSFDAHFWIARVFAGSIPTDINEIDGIGHTWQGENLFLRVSCAKAAIEREALAHSWSAIETSECPPNHFDIPSELEAYLDSPWLPDLNSPGSLFRSSTTHASDKTIWVWYSAEKQIAYIRFTGT